MKSTDALRSRLEALLPDTLDFLKRLVDVNSFTGNPDGVNHNGGLIAAAFAPLGFSMERVPCAYSGRGDHLVLTRPGGGKKSLMLVSHLDTVFPVEEELRNNFHWRREGDRIHGPGVLDIKGGTALMWMILRALAETHPAAFEEVTWKLLWNAAEEVLSDDFGDVCRNRLDGSDVAALVFEAGGRADGKSLLVVQRKGRAVWRARVFGKGAHAGSKHAQGANAIRQLARLVERIEAMSDPAIKLTFNTGLVHGGGPLNRVPHEAFAEGELRAFDQRALAAAKEALLAMAGIGDVRAAADGHACLVEVEITHETRSWPRNDRTDQLLAHWLAAAEEIGQPAGSESRGGLSDGNHIWDAIPTLDGLGPWGEFSHASERSEDGTKLPEYVDARSFAPKALWNALAILRMIE